jgi:hypothetical protein
MSVLLYFVSFASVLALLASAIAVAFWVLAKFFRAWGRFIRALFVPPDISRRRSDISVHIDPNHLKRAGQ